MNHYTFEFLIRGSITIIENLKLHCYTVHDHANGELLTILHFKNWIKRSLFILKPPKSWLQIYSLHKLYKHLKTSYAMLQFIHI